MSTNPNQRQKPVRKFEIKPAKFVGTSLYLSLVGPSGSGKTFSAFELARGMQVVTGGKIVVVDTENFRALHYAEQFQFDYKGNEGLLHVPFAPPYPPSAYQTVYETIVKDPEIKIVITDSYTHEHEGLGGVLEMHDAELARGIKDPSAWGEPKGERSKLKEFILQAKNLHFIFCFRAKEKMRWFTGGRPPEARGLMPLGDESFIFEQVANFLLPAGANGVPVLSSPYPDEELIIKLPKQYRGLFTEPRQLSAALGTHLAAWAVPSWKGVLPPLPAPMKRGQSASVGYSATMAKTLSVPVVTTVNELISKFETITDFSTMGDLRTAYDTVRATASAEDVVRLNAAKDACFDRLDPIETAASESTERTVILPSPAAGTTITIRKEDVATVVIVPSASEKISLPTGPTVPIPGPVSPVDSLIATYARAPDVAAVDALEELTRRLLAISSPEDCARIKSAANSALDRLDPPIVTDPPPSKVAKPVPGLTEATITLPPSQPVVPSTPITKPTPVQPSTSRVLSEIEQLNRDGLAAFREALNSYDGPITQEQAAQLVRDHLSEYAKPPKVGTEDGAMAQDEIMKRTQPPFASRASLGVMRRHLEQCDAFPMYKEFCRDLTFCTTAENVYECWRINGDIVDALPKQPQNDARLRAVKKVEEVDPTIKDGGPWLTARIKRGKAEAEAAGVKPVVVAPVTPVAPTTTIPVVIVTHAAVSNGVPPELPPSAPIVPPNPTPNHAPITSDVGQVLANDLEKAATLEATDEMRTRVDRAFLQKRIPTADAKTLQALCEAKKASFAT